MCWPSRRAEVLAPRPSLPTSRQRGRIVRGAARIGAFARNRYVLGAAGLFVLLAAAYSFSIGLRATSGASITADEPFYLLTTQSLLQDGNLDLTRQYADETYRSFFDHPGGLWKQSVPTGGRLLSPHEPGLSVLLLPGFAAGGLVGTQVQLMLLAAATFAGAFLLVALETRAFWLSWFTTAAAALAAPGFVYATEIYPELPAAFCLVVALLILRRDGGGVAQAAGMALVLSALAWLGMKYAPLGAVVAVAYLWRAPMRSRMWFAGLAAVSAGVYAWFHLSLYGAWTVYSANTVYEGAPTSVVLESHLAFDGRVYRIWGLFIDRRFGIGRWAPIFLAVLPALPLLLRSGRTGRLTLALIGTAIFMASFVAITMMGWWFPGRMLMVVYPLFALVLVLALQRMRPWMRVVAAALAVYSLAVTAALAYAGGSGEIRIAVDPFAMGAAFFRVLGPAFPQYTAWGLDTQLLNAAWLAAGGACLAFVAWHELRPSFARLRGRVAPSRAPAPRPVAQPSGNEG